MTTKRMTRFKRLLSLRILSDFIVKIVLYTVAIFLLFFGGSLFFSFRTYDGTELIYPLLHFLHQYAELLLISSLFFGHIGIFLHCWMKTLNYLEAVVSATENIYNSSDDMIQLPGALKEVENQMNKIKLGVKNSQRLAKEAEQRKNDLVVYLAHDLKTPLTSVIGYLTLLRDEQQISEELREKYLSISLNKAERLEDLINEFFEITRFNLTNLTLDLSRVNLTRMLEQLTYEFKPMFADKHLDCQLNAPSRLMIKCDVNKMQRVFDNLLRNAINYSFENSTIKITVTSSETDVRLIFFNRGNTIPEEKLNRIFEQFYRLDTARTTKSGGAGLGLAIAKEIVELHHGTISAQSADEYIRFDVCLPLL